MRVIKLSKMSKYQSDLLSTEGYTSKATVQVSEQIGKKNNLREKLENREKKKRMSKQ